MWRKNCHVENFQLSVYDDCREIKNFKCLPMTDVEKSEILNIWYVCDVKNVAIHAKFMIFSWKNQFCQNLGTLLQNPFCRNIRTFVWRKIYPKILYVEKKKTNIRSVTLYTLHMHWQASGRIWSCSSERNARWKTNVFFIFQHYH